MIRFILTLCLAVAAASILAFADLAYSYTFTTGHGLHPGLAGIGIVLMLAYMVCVIRLMRSADKPNPFDELEYVDHRFITGVEPLETLETWK